MLTGEIRSEIGAIWDSFWSGGIFNPLEAKEPIAYLLFIRRLDDIHAPDASRLQGDLLRGRLSLIL
mgnify:CR=1 FL=1